MVECVLVSCLHQISPPLPPSFALISPPLKPTIILPLKSCASHTCDLPILSPSRLPPTYSHIPHHGSVFEITAGAQHGPRRRRPSTGKSSPSYQAAVAGVCLDIFRPRGASVLHFSQPSPPNRGRACRPARHLEHEHDSMPSSRFTNWAVGTSAQNGGTSSLQPTVSCSYL